LDFPESDFDILSLLFQGSDDAVVVCNPAGEIILFNGTASRVYGTLHSVQLQDCPEMFGMMLPNGSRLLRVEELPMFRALQGQEVRHFPILLRARNVPDRMVEVDAIPVKKDGEIIGAIVKSRHKR
jgi:two-component system, sensor histidine kinase and response regulator